MLALGRFYAEDNRDKNYPLTTKLSGKNANKQYKYWWSSGWWGNQGSSPHCVAYSWLHWLEDGPVTHFYKGRNFDPWYLNTAMKQKHQSLFNPVRIYESAQKRDRWEGENYNGTSVRAGAKVLRDLGVISEFRWATSIDDVVNSLLELGPMVVGTWWYSDMFYPTKKGIIRPTGNKVGGHAYVLNGINTKKNLLRIKNSWGRNSWGKNGYAYIDIDDFGSLLNDYGEACMAFEKKLK